MAESGGRQYAHSPTNDFGYWQINGVHGAMATYNPIRNAKAAIAISSNGRNWRPWTTYVTGAYRGRCKTPFLGHRPRHVGSALWTHRTCSPGGTGLSEP